MIDVSVIITTRDEENNIKNCLTSIERQSYPKNRVEIIVVDNNSSDKTKEISGRYTDKIYNYGPERSAQRNFGIKNAFGKYVLYLDADMILSEGVIAECVNKCEESGLLALYIPERIIGTGFWIRVRDFERGFYNATVIDCVRFIRRDKFLEIKGFDENLTGPEDWDLDRRIRKAGVVDIIDSPIYHNEGRFCLQKYLNKKKYYATDFRNYIGKWGKDDYIIKKQFGFWYRLFGVFIENGKWKKTLAHLGLASGMIALKYMVGIFHIKQKFIDENK